MQPGPAFVTKEVLGAVSWGGMPKQLESVESTDDIAKLVVFDTWVRNLDRFPPDGTGRRPNYDNVFFAPVAGNARRYTICAIDHTHCISQGREIGNWLAGIDCVKDEKIYGLFPEFRKFVTPQSIKRSLADLNGIDEKTIVEIVESTPLAWGGSEARKKTVCDFIIQRKAFIITSVYDRVKTCCQWQGELSNGDWL